MIYQVVIANLSKVSRQMDELPDDDDIPGRQRLTMMIHHNHCEAVASDTRTRLRDNQITNCGLDLLRGRRIGFYPQNTSIRTLGDLFS